MEHYILPADETRLPQRSRSVALGLFDGLHIGHRAVIAASLRNGQGECAVYTFLADTVTTKPAGQRIFGDEEHRRRMAEAHVQELIEADFSAVRELTPEEFVDTVLAEQLHAHAVACGSNYRFGRGGRGDAAMLQALCARRGIAVTVVPTVECADGPVSSTAIRSALAAGDMAAVRRMLGQAYCLRLPVTHGQQLGRRLAMPTVNQLLPEGTALPRFGVYASSVEIGERTFVGVTNIGEHPTVGAAAPLAETWIQDFSDDVYGQTVRVYPVAFLRPEQAFADLSALQRQAALDAQQARALFAPTGKIRAVLFDLDDTLHLRDKAFADAAEAYVNQYFPEKSPADRERLCREMIALNDYGYRMPCSYPEFIARFLPDGYDEGAVDTLMGDFFMIFAENCHILPEAVELLSTLHKRGFPLGILTNGDSRLQNEKLSLSGVRSLVDISVPAGDEGLEKPHPTLFRRLAGRLGVACADCLFVGDNASTDIEGALGAEMQAVRIDFGHPADHPIYEHPLPAGVDEIHRLEELLTHPALQKCPQPATANQEEFT